MAGVVVGRRISAHIATAANGAASTTRSTRPLSTPARGSATAPMQARMWAIVGRHDSRTGWEITVPQRSLRSSACGAVTLLSTSLTTDAPEAALIHSSGLIVMR